MLGSLRQYTPPSQFPNCRCFSLNVKFSFCVGMPPTWKGESCDEQNICVM